MLALVDGVPRTLTLDQFIRHWITHQIEVIAAAPRYRLRKAEERAHILRGYLKALDALDEVIALIRAQRHVDDARDRPDGAARDRRDPGHRDPRHAAAPPRRPRAAEDHRRVRRADARDRRLQRHPRQRAAAALDRQRGARRDRRRSTATSGAPIFVPWDGDVTDEDLIAEEDVVVTITRGGYAKRTSPTSTARSGAAARACGARPAAGRRRRALLRRRPPTTGSCSSPTRAGSTARRPTELPDAGRDARGQHVANLLAFQPDETIAQVLDDPRLRGRALPRARDPRGPGEEDPARRSTTPTAAAASSRSTCATTTSSSRRPLVTDDDDLLLVSPQGHVGAVHRRRRHAAPDGPRHLRRHRHALPRRRRSCSRWTSSRPDTYVVTVTDGGYAKRTRSTSGPPRAAASSASAR